MQVGSYLCLRLTGITKCSLLVYIPKKRVISQTLRWWAMIHPYDSSPFDSKNKTVNKTNIYIIVLLWKVKIATMRKIVTLPPSCLTRILDLLMYVQHWQIWEIPIWPCSNYEFVPAFWWPYIKLYQLISTCSQLITI